MSFTDPHVEGIDYTRVRSMPVIFAKKVPSLSTLDDLSALDQEPLGKSIHSALTASADDRVVAIDEELPSDEFNTGFDALAPLDLEITF